MKYNNVIKVFCPGTLSLKSKCLHTLITDVPSKTMEYEQMLIDALGRFTIAELITTYNQTFRQGKEPRKVDYFADKQECHMIKMNEFITLKNMIIEIHIKEGANN